MTTLSVRPVSDPDLLDLLADQHTPLGKPLADKFRAACKRVADSHGGDVDPNLVRAELIDDPDYDPRQYAALWAPACGRSGFLRKTDVRVPICGQGSRGNSGKDVPLRRWIG